MARLVILSTDRSRRIVIVLIGRNEEHQLSIELDVQLDLGDFKGRDSAIHVETDSLSSFITGLSELEKTRKGEACLESMSPADFSLKVRATDPAGHMIIEVSLHKHEYHGDTLLDYQVMGGFELNPGDLPGLVQSFQALRCHPT